jgi:hypothetical protein
MILYHYTGSWNIASICAGGLKPVDDCWKDWLSLIPELAQYEPAVWLTSSPEYASFKDPETGKTMVLDRRITVTISSSDRRLQKWSKLLRKFDVTFSPDADGARAAQSVRASYVYFGAVEPDRFRVVTEMDYRFSDGTSVGR